MAIEMRYDDPVFGSEFFSLAGYKADVNLGDLENLDTCDPDGLEGITVNGTSLREIVDSGKYAQ